MSAVSTGEREAPKNASALQRELARVAREWPSTVKRLQSLLANVVVAQMVPDAAVKGGTGLKLRFGENLTRETPDLDAAFRGDREVFLEDFTSRLSEGWGYFTGKAVVRDQRAPADLIERVSTAYVMQPIDIKLSYRGKSFTTVELELGYDELEATTREPIEHELSDDIVRLFTEVGLPTPNPVRVLPLHHQISQKLHACSEPGSPRAHDLVDLQLMCPRVDQAKVAEACVRLFRFRQFHSWPPTVVAADGWAQRYEAAAEGLDVRGLDDAITWINEYIADLAAL